jgi:hypothetical protein
MTTIKLKNGSGAPTAGDLAQGEPALDLTNKRLYTEDSGGTVIEVGTNPGVDVTFADNRKAIFGAGSDLQIYHDGSNSYINDTGTGNLFVRASDNFYVQNSAGTETKAAFTTDGAVTLYYNGGTKFQTVSGGIDVTGSVVADSYDIGTLGTLGSVATDRLFIATADGLGLQFDFDNSRIVPVGADGSTYNNNVSLGASSLEFKNLFLSGAVTAGGLTVDGSANVKSSGGKSTISIGDTAANTYAQLLLYGGATKYNWMAAAQYNVNNGFEITPSTATEGVTFSNPALRIDFNRDISFFEDTGTTAKLFWDASAESLGIGTSSPESGLHLFDGTNVNAPQNANRKATLTIEAGSEGSADIQMLNASYNHIFFGDAADANVGYFLYDHTNNSMQFATNAAERMRINSSGNVGIGTSSPSRKFHVDASGVTALFGNTEANNSIELTRTTSSASYVSLAANSSTAGIVAGPTFTFSTANSGGGAVNERMRIDSSGNLLVGKTSNTISAAGAKLGTSGSNFTRDSDEVVYVNRTTNDGSLITLAKDGTTVGSIGVEGSDLTIGTGDTGLQFRDASDAIRPFNISTNAARDANIDLGRSSERFRDLYLSGGAYLGGTGSANHLDDYEEGTFTVTFPSGVTSPTYVIQSGSYVKIGKLVTFQIRIELSAGTANSSHIKIGGLPFTSTSASSYGGAFFNYSQGFITDIGARTMHIGANGTLISFYKTDGNSLAGTEVDDITGTIFINGQYEVA